jgi:hypothetical protein
MSTVIETLWKLLGRRSDDPEVLAFHESLGMPPPPAVMTLKIVYDVAVPPEAVEIHYGGQLRRLDSWPPRRVRGRYVGYLAMVCVKPQFGGPLLHGVPMDLSYEEAEKRAVESSATAIFQMFTMVRDEERRLTFVFRKKDKTLLEIRLSPAQLEKADPRLAELEAAAEANAPPPPVRRPPERELEPFPEALTALAALQRFDNVDLEVLTAWQRGGPKAWTGNPAAEAAFAVFAQDGSGGLVAFWRVHDAPIELQPVVFLGSEGEVGAVASDLADFLYLLACGVGPYEAIEYGCRMRGEGSIPAVEQLARQLDPRPPRPPEDILAAASEHYGDIEAHVLALRPA